MQFFESLRRAWRRHDESLADRALRDAADVEALDADGVVEAGGNMGMPGSEFGVSAALREEHDVEHEHPPGEPE